MPCPLSFGATVCKVVGTVISAIWVFKSELFALRGSKISNSRPNQKGVAPRGE